MAKRKRPKVTPQGNLDTDTVMLRIVNVTTAYGDFLRLMYVTEREGKVISMVPVHEYFQELSEIAHRLDHMADALVMPILSGEHVVRPH